MNRIANATIDTYTTAVVLSRASKSLKNKLPSADHEVLLAQLWAFEVSIPNDTMNEIESNTGDLEKLESG